MYPPKASPTFIEIPRKHRPPVRENKTAQAQLKTKVHYTRPPETLACRYQKCRRRDYRSTRTRSPSFPRTVKIKRWKRKMERCIALSPPSQWYESTNSAAAGCTDPPKTPPPGSEKVKMRRRKYNVQYACPPNTLVCIYQKRKRKRFSKFPLPSLWHISTRSASADCRDPPKKTSPGLGKLYAASKKNKSSVCSPFRHADMRIPQAPPPRAEIHRNPLPVAPPLWKYRTTEAQKTKFTQLALPTH